MNDNGDVSDYAANALNQYQNVGGGDVYYDDKFNLMWTGGFSAGYDAVNHLTAIGSGEDYGQFTYDGLGRCVKRNVNWETTIITYDGWSPIAEWDEWNNLSAWNVYGGSADEILWRYSDRSGHLRYHTDRQGNVIALLDYNGNGIERYSYDAFGHPTITDWTGTSQRDFSWYWNRFMFRGREYFPEFSLYDMRARFYYPALGRFLQSDPIGFAGGDANLFRYCGSDPVNGSDPSGLLEPETVDLPRITVIGSYPGDFGNSSLNIDQGGANNAGSDERSYPHTFGDGWRTAPPITPWRLPDEDDAEDGDLAEATRAGDGPPSGTKDNVPAVINALERAVPQYTGSFPQAPSPSSVVQALQQAQSDNRIQIGGRFLPGEGMHTIGNRIYINPRGDFSKYGFAPSLAHEGVHLVDPTPRSDQFQRERNAYDIQYFFSTITGPSQVRKSDEEIRSDLLGFGHRRRTW